ncbi:MULTISPECIES: hypothetical protein [Actinomadura]|nr:hypothetical protein [Actinomadura sp. J1-007]MWK34499.1 hypothetical protein [Actinomadura sp. J1-007]
MAPLFVLGQYLDSPADYSKECEERISGLGEELSRLLAVSLSHGSDMNYNAGQRLGTYLLADRSPTQDPRAATYSLGIWISTKGPLWTLLLHRGEPGKAEWFPAPLSEVAGTPEVDSLLHTIETYLRSKGYTRISEEALDEMLPDKETEMDGAPATVRDVFFCEIC